MMKKARKSRESYSKSWQKYRALSAQLRHLKIEIERQADEWPMYARPVLYTQQDYHARVEFAHALEHIYNANDLVPEIASHKLCEQPEESYTWSSLRKNILIVQAVSYFNYLVSELESIIGKITETKESIKIDYENNLQIQKRIFQELEALETRILDWENKIETLKNVNNDIWWASSLARRSCDAALKNIQVHHDDGVEYAAADIFIRIGKDLLYYLEIYLDSLSEERFELDELAKLLREAYDRINSTLDNDVLDNWKTIRKTDSDLRALPIQLKRAQLSWENFKKIRDKFLSLENRVKSYSLEKTVRRADALQKECAFYWYPSYQKPEIWDQVLNKHPLPLKTIRDLQNEYIAQIRPIIECKQGLKQTDLNDLLELFKLFVARYITATEDIKLLHNKLLEHKQAQIVVYKLIDTYGAANKAIQAVALIIKDADPNIVAEGSEILQIYQNYYTVARAITGANFPELVTKLNDLINCCNFLNSEHEKILHNLQAITINLGKELEENLTEIVELIESFPKISDAIRDILVSARKDGREIITKLELSRGYNQLNQLQNAIREWSEQYEYQIINTREQRIAFNAARTKTKADLINFNTELAAREFLNSVAWRWAKREIQQFIESAQFSVDEQWRDWNMNENQGWRMLYLTDAVRFCNDIDNAINAIRAELNQNVANAAREEYELAEKRRGMLLVINGRKTKNRIQPRSDEFAEKLCNSAFWASSKVEAKFALDVAQKVLNGKASKNEIHQAQTIINNINTGGGTYVGGNVNTSGGDFVGRDQRIQASKARPHARKNN
jgi:hypothetical protein